MLTDTVSELLVLALKWFKLLLQPIDLLITNLALFMHELIELDLVLPDMLKHVLNVAHILASLIVRNVEASEDGARIHSTLKVIRTETFLHLFGPPDLLVSAYFLR